MKDFVYFNNYSMTLTTPEYITENTRVDQKVQHNSNLLTIQQYIGNHMKSYHCTHKSTTLIKQQHIIYDKKYITYHMRSHPLPH